MTTTSRRPHQWPRLATSTYISDIINALPGRGGYASGHSSTHKVCSDSHEAGKSRLTHSYSGREHRRCSSSNAFCTQSLTYLISMNLTVVGPGLLSQIQHITLNNRYTKRKAGWPAIWPAQYRCGTCTIVLDTKYRCLRTPANNIHSWSRAQPGPNTMRGPDVQQQRPFTHQGLLLSVV